MSKTLLIAADHLRRETRKRSFILVLLSMPLFLTFIIGFGYLVAQLEEDQTTVGYVDNAGVLVDTAPAGVERPDTITLQPFADRGGAQEALDADQIGAYFVVDAAYRQSGDVELVRYDPVDYRAVNYVQTLLRVNLLADRSPEAVARYLDGTQVAVTDTSTGREYDEAGPGLGLFVPLAVAFIFAFLVLTTAGYMMSAVVEEKENRTMEIMITSVSPNQMMAGKVLGALTIGLIQLIVWTAFLLGAIWIGSTVLDIAWLREIDPSWRDFGMIILVALPAYVFIAAMMTLIGSTLVESQEAQQAGSLFFIPMFLPLYLIVPLVENPDGPLAVIMTLIPFTSVMTIAMRSILYVIPAWQIAAAVLIAAVGAGVMMWLAGRALRLSMLRYGQRLRLGELFGRTPPPDQLTSQPAD